MSAARNSIDTTQPFQTAEPLVKLQASGGQRCVAFLMDSFFSFLGVTVLMSFFTAILPGGFLGFAINLGVGMIIFPIIYWVNLPLHFGATPGKKIMGIEIVDSRSQSPATFAQLMTRELVGRPISGFTFLMGYIWFWVSEDQSTWHDLMAKTKVVQS